MIMDREIEEYIHNISTPEDPVLKELFRQTHLRFVNPNRSCGYIQGHFLEFIARMIKPAFILEIGTFTGYSTICLAKGLMSEGEVITIESNDEITEFAGSYFSKAGVQDRIIQLTGRAQDIIPELEQTFDLVYIDGDKREYSEYYRLVIEKVNPGGYIIADNVLWGGKITDNETRDPQTRGIIEFNEMIKNQKNIENHILPMRDGIMIIKKNK
jgi:caffeoyl-CoA O-methyltransferase